MMSYTYLVPQDTKNVLGHHFDKCENFGLILERYVPQEAIIETDRRDNRGKVIGKERSFWLKDICEDFKPNSDLITAMHTRWCTMTEGSASFTMLTRSRLIIGLGGKGALEFGMTLHPVTGLPYIPGSALKGLCRNYTLYYIAAESNISLDPNDPATPQRAKELEEHLTGEKEHSLKVDPAFITMFQNLFGTQSEAGKVVFFDAVMKVPPDGRLFALEVMTPHFREYYESAGKKPPHDSDNPNPITYLSVDKGVTFVFAVGRRGNVSADGAQLQDARELLRMALDEMGIGAKTAAGYGVFEPQRKKK